MNIKNHFVVRLSAGIILIILGRALIVFKEIKMNIFIELLFYLLILVAVFILFNLYTHFCAHDSNGTKKKKKEKLKYAFVTCEGVKWRYAKQSKDGKCVEGTPYCIKDNTLLVFIDANLEDDTYIYECVTCQKKFKIVDYAKAYYDADILMRKKMKLPGPGYEINPI